MKNSIENFRPIYRVFMDDRTSVDAYAFTPDQAYWGLAGHYHGLEGQREAIAFKLIHDPEDLSYGLFRGCYKHETDDKGVRRYRGIGRLSERERAK